MTIDIKNKETFLYEIETLKREKDMSTLEAMLFYIQKYGLDENYLAEYLLTPKLKQELQEECEKVNMIKKSERLEGI